MVESGNKWMFFGSFEHNLDAKGRLIIPARFKGEVGSLLYVMKGYDGCLSVYKEEDFQKLLVKVQQLSFTQKASRAFIRTQLGSCRELEVDKMSRILLPKDLLSKYQIGKTVVVVGVGDHLEIWDKDVYDKYENEVDASFEEIAETINPGE